MSFSITGVNKEKHPGALGHVTVLGLKQQARELLIAHGATLREYVTAAVGIHCCFVPAYEDGVIIGIYNHHAGKFTVNTFNIIGNLGNPAADRLLLNMAARALPADYEAEPDSLGIQ